ncbi:MAG: hypothetical protein ABJP02_12985 [Parasphingorhabdus sp.]
MTNRVIWPWLAIIYLVFALELVVGLRHGLRMTVNDVMQSADFYDERASIQWMLVAFLMACVLILPALYRISKSKLGPLPKNHFAAIMATVILLLLFVLELISFHQVDALLYHISGGIMVIAWMWVAMAFVAVTAALIAIACRSNPSLKDN